jgi:phosphoglycolate phosphatase
VSGAFAHVAFDLDGTLVDSRADLAAATNHVRRSFDLAPLEPAAVYGLVGDGARALVERALGPVPAARADEGVRRFLAFYREHLLDETRPYPGMESALRALHARGVVLSVLTNKPEDLSRAILDGLGLTHWLASVVGGDSLPTRKPDPAGVQVLLARSGTRAADFLLVGDSPVDFETAEQAGVAFCGVTWGLVPERLRACAPSLLIDDAAALIPLVERGVSRIGSRLA